MECYVCKKTPAQGTNLYRQNKKGEKGIWACSQHSKPVDGQLTQIVGYLQKHRSPPK